MPGAVFLEGEKINLRTIEAEDAERLRDIINQPEIRTFLGVRNPLNLDDEKDWIDSLKERDDTLLAICIDGELIGNIKLEEKDPWVGEIGIMIDREHHGNGYGTEASQLIIDHGFNELGYRRVMARVFEPNEASTKLWEKLGFQREGELREHILHEGDYKDAYIYGLLIEEWNS